MTRALHASLAHTNDWSSLSLVVAAGIVVAVQVGKVAIATPLLQADLSLDLAAIGWLTGVFALLGLLGGLLAGTFVTRAGARGVLILGLLLTLIGCVMGAMATAYPLLLLSRVVEGAGFLLVIVAAPSLIEQVIHPAQRDLAFALWSCFMPAGMAFALLAGSLFESWRAIWWSSALMTLLIALAVAVVIPDRSTRLSGSWRTLRTNTLRTIQAEGPLLIAAIFALYSLMFFALFSFLPVLLMERMQVSHQMAGWMSATATAVNIIGNLTAGALLSRGVRRPTLLASASLVMGLSGLGIFLPLFPDTGTYLLCIVFSAVGGLIPATLMSSAPLVAPSAALIPIVLGLVVQGNNLGQLVGPVFVGNAIQNFGWTAAALIVAAAAVTATVLAVTSKALVRAGTA